MDVLFLLEELYRDPLVLSKFSQFRSYTVNEGESISNLNENQEFQICFVLKGTLRFSNNQANSMPKLITKNELFFISHFHECNIKAIENVHIVVYACNVIAPYFYTRVLEYLGDTSTEKVPQRDIFPVYPLMLSYLHSLVDYMKMNVEIQELHQAKECELFSLFKICYSKQQLIQIFRDALSKDVQFFVSVMKHYKTCRTAKELAMACGYNMLVFNQLFKICFHGSTPYQWLQKQTSSEIEYKLKKTRQPIKEIMLEYHFKTFSHFTAYCKRNIGNAPNEVRRRENLA